MSNLTLRSILPNLSSNHSIQISPQSSSSTPKLNYALLNTDNEIYFLSSFQKPTNVKINFNLNVNLNEIEFNKTVVINYEIKNLNYEVNFIFQFKVKNATFKQILAAEMNVLKYFRTQLWRRETFFYNKENNELDILSIRPGENDTFIFEIGTDIGQSSRLSNLITFKDDHLKECSELIDNDELINFKKSTNLEIDLCSIDFYSSDNDLDYDLNYTINANYSIKIQDQSKSIESIKRILILISILILINGLCLVSVFYFFRCFSSDLSEKNDSKKKLFLTIFVTFFSLIFIISINFGLIYQFYL